MLKSALKYQRAFDYLALFGTKFVSCPSHKESGRGELKFELHKYLDEPKLEHQYFENLDVLQYCKDHQIQ